MLTKQEILNEIRRTAGENGEKPLGRARFEQATGIKAYNFHKYWARFNDAIIEAGFAPNQMVSSYGLDYLIEKLIDLIRELGKFPTNPEMVLKRNKDAEFPDKKTFERLGSKENRARKVIEYCINKVGYDDVIAICAEVVEISKRAVDIDEDVTRTNVGSVYLFKSGRYYKIGKTNDTIRRGTELRIQLPEDLTLIHEIKTDDPGGIEAYWHKRFQAKRKNGEWFDLSFVDIKAFKAWKRIL